MQSNASALDYYGQLSNPKTQGYKHAEEILKRRTNMEGATA